MLRTKVFEQPVAAQSVSSEFASAVELPEVAAAFVAVRRGVTQEERVESLFRDVRKVEHEAEMPDGMTEEDEEDEAEAV